MEQPVLFSLSHAQQRIWINELINPGTPWANVCFTIRYKGEAQFDSLQKAINQAVAGNDSLRLRMIPYKLNGITETRQYVASPETIHIEMIDFTDPSNSASLESWLKAEVTKPFNLYDHPLCLFVMIRYSASEWGYLMKFHHAVGDGATVILLINDIDRSMKEISSGKQPVKTNIPSYVQYLSDEAGYLESDDCVADREYWMKSLQPLPGIADLSGKKQPVDDIRAETVIFQISGELRDQIHIYADSAKTSVFKLCLSALSLAIARETGLDDFVISTVNHGRTTPEQMTTTGMFVATMLLRIRTEPAMSFAAFNENNSSLVNQSVRRYGRYPADKLMMELREATGADPKGLMNVMIVGHPNISEKDIPARYHFPGCEPIPLTLHINISGLDAHGILELQFDYRQGLYVAEDMERLFLEMTTILHQALSNPGISLSEFLKPEYPNLIQAPATGFFPASQVQQRILTSEKMGATGSANSLHYLALLEGDLETERLSKVITELTSAHEILRTSFRETTEGLIDVIHPRVRVKRILREVSEDHMPQVIREFMRPFHPDRAPLFRTLLLKINPTRHYFLFVVHQAIIDPVSLKLLMEDLWNLYEGEPVRENATRYRDFALWQQQFISNRLMRPRVNRWLNRFKNNIPVLNLETDFPRGTSIQLDGGVVTAPSNTELTRQIDLLAGIHGIRPELLFQTALFVLLHKYTHQEDIVTGMPFSGRTRAEFKDIPGSFSNLLPVMVHLTGEDAFIACLQEVARQVAFADENQDYPFGMLLESLGIRRDAGRNPLFDVLFTLEDEFSERMIGGLSLRPVPIDATEVPYDLTLAVRHRPSGYSWRWIYRRDLFMEPTIRALNAHFVNLLNQVTGHPEIQLRNLDLLQPGEKDFLLKQYNDTSHNYPREKTITSLFEEQVSKTPGAVAIDHNGRTLSFRELNSQVNQFARLLQQKGIQPDQVVAIMMEPSVEFIIAVMGVLKAGGAYLPIDPEYPADRISYILENSAVMIQITNHNSFREDIPFDGAVLYLERDWMFTGDDSNLPQTAGPGNLVYIIYTSGSTGRPKGVMITHQGLVNYITWAARVYLEDEKLNFPLYSSISFDLTVTSIFTPLATGNQVVIYAGGEKSVLIERLIHENKSGIIKLTPSHLAMLDTYDCAGSSIRRFIVGGEELRTTVARKIMEKFGNDAKIFNEYGPTETVVGCMIHLFDPLHDTRPAVPIGIPGDNVHIYLLDKYLNLVPRGVPGEMYIAGDGVARGYMNRPDITAERFLPDPFFPGMRMYKTGDLAKFLPSGTIEFLGRIDFQVKIRGFRIELGEIENQLSRYPGIREVVVLPHQDTDGSHYLCAYYVAPEAYAIPALKSFLADTLPDYMIPSFFFRLNSIPHTPNGKVDRNKLPKKGDEMFTGMAFTAPRNEPERLIAEGFCRILNLAQAGINDSFFDLGGDSLKAIALVAELQKHFEVKMNDIFTHQTIALLAKNIRQAGNQIPARLARLKDRMPELVASVEQLPEASRYITSAEQYRASLKNYDALDYTITKSYQTVFLTGSTGYLGIFLLRDLLRNTQAKIILPVRAEDQEKAREKLHHKASWYFGEAFLESFAHRVEVLQADLGEEKLGLDAAAYDRLCGEVDCVIHAAALVKHYGHYDEFYKSNVQSTLNLITLAMTGIPKDLHHVSTVSVGMGNIPGRQVCFFTEDDMDIGQQSDIHYLTTKLEAEKQVAKARETGLNASIYRVGNITFDSETGRSQENLEDNAFYHLVRSFLNLGCVPDIMDEFEFSFVDQVSKAILTLYDKPLLLNGTYHIRNPHVVKLSELFSLTKLDLRLSAIPFGDFMDQLSDLFQWEEFKPYVEAILLHMGWMDAVEGDGLPVLYQPVCTRTEQILKRNGYTWPELDPAAMENLIVAAYSERIKELAQIPVLSGLEEEDLVAIARLATRKHIPMDIDILWEGEPDDHVYIILQGHVEISKHSRTGWLGTIRVVSRGGILGPDRLYSDKPSSYTAGVILSDIQVYTLSITDLRQLILAHPRIATALIRMLAYQYDQLSNLFVNMT